MLSLMSIKTKKSTGQDVGPNGQTDFPYSFHTAFIHCNVVMVFNSDQLISKGYQCYALCKINQVWTSSLFGYLAQCICWVYNMLA